MLKMRCLLRLCKARACLKTVYFVGLSSPAIVLQVLESKMKVFHCQSWNMQYTNVTWGVIFDNPFETPFSLLLLC